MKNKIVFEKTFEGFLDKVYKNNQYDNLENLSKTSMSGEVDLKTKNNILDVNNFNKWLTDEYDNFGGSGYSKNLIGNISILKTNMIEQYFLDQGVECTPQDFIDKIKNEWK